MRSSLILLPGLALLVAACQHSSAYDDAWAKCEAEALESFEASDPQPDQRASAREDYIRQCMTDQGFTQ